jgi:hypothetical protein
VHLFFYFLHSAHSDLVVSIDSIAWFKAATQLTTYAKRGGPESTSIEANTRSQVKKKKTGEKFAAGREKMNNRNQRERMSSIGRQTAEPTKRPEDGQCPTCATEDVITRISAS